MRGDGKGRRLTSPPLTSKMLPSALDYESTGVILIVKSEERIKCPH